MTGNEVKEEEIKPGWVYVGVGGGLPEESLMPQYRLWAFVTHKFGIRALCGCVFVGMCGEMASTAVCSQLVLISACFCPSYDRKCEGPITSTCFAWWIQHRLYTNIQYNAAGEIPNAHFISFFILFLGMFVAAQK